MNSRTAQQLEDFVATLVTEGEQLLKKKHPKPLPPGWSSVGSPQILVPRQECATWRAKCRQLAQMLGSAGEAWKGILSSDFSDEAASTEILLGTAQAIKAVITAGLLVRVEGLVRAEVFSDILGQAEHLHEQNYILAAGVLGRAVLEEHLRAWCVKEQCSPTKARPGIDDYNKALYAAQHLDKIAMKHVEAMAAVGNDAAHNKAGLKAEDVERMLRDVRDFVARHPL